MNILTQLQFLEAKVISSIKELEGIKLRKGELTFRFMLSGDFSFKIDDGEFEQLIVEEKKIEGGVLTYFYPEYTILEIQEYSHITFFFLSTSRGEDINEVLLMRSNNRCVIP